MLLDYRDFVVHLFLDKDREYYSLDKLWDRP
ncbi:MAG: RsfS/YbeB/iojap family protein [Oscillospiraceae bacterium]|nr:RsfS/YbeB/iojap family protein [Oscillospiraceae bacterium]